MPKGKANLNSIYISDRLQKCMQPISSHPLTTLIAPMGYGKTTAVNWYLSRFSQEDQLTLIRISIYSPTFPSSGKVCRMDLLSQVWTF